MVRELPGDVLLQRAYGPPWAAAGTTLLRPGCAGSRRTGDSPGRAVPPRHSPTSARSSSGARTGGTDGSRPRERRHRPHERGPRPHAACGTPGRAFGRAGRDLPGGDRDPFLGRLSHEGRRRGFVRRGPGTAEAERIRVARPAELCASITAQHGPCSQAPAAMEVWAAELPRPVPVNCRRHTSMERSERIVQSGGFQFGINTITTTATDECNRWERIMALGLCPTTNEARMLYKLVRISMSIRTG